MTRRTGALLLVVGIIAVVFMVLGVWVLVAHANASVDAGATAAIAPPVVPSVTPASTPILVTVLSWGDKVLSWVLALLGTLLSTYVIKKYLSGSVRDLLLRAWAEVIDAVIEVKQTYTDSLKTAAADGRLTTAESEEAKHRAVQIAKSNLGAKGLARLARVIGVDVDRWLSTKVESTLAKIKRATPGNPR
jgi:hypothetical protein